MGEEMEEVSKGIKSLRASAPEFTLQSGTSESAETLHSSFFTGLEGTAIQLEKASPEKAGSSRNPTFSVKPKNNSLEGSPSRDSGKKQPLNTSPSRQPRRSPVTQDNSKSCLTRDIFETSHSAESIKRKIENIFCSSQVSSNLPTAINQYHSLYQIEEKPSGVPGCLNYRSLSSSDGKVYLLRRVLGNSQFDSQFVIKCVERWKRVRHPSIVPLCEAFTTFAFTQGAANELVFVYPFYDNAHVFREVYLSNDMNMQLSPLPEKIIWTLFVQLTSSLDALHSAEMIAGESLSPNGILVVGTHRIRLNKCGVAETLSTDAVGSRSYSQHGLYFLNDFQRKKQEDVWRLMHLLFLLTLRSQASIVKNGVLQVGVNEALNVLQQTAIYSDDILNILAFLVDHYNRSLPVSVTQILSLVTPQIVYDYSHVWLHADRLEAELNRRLNASRLFRIISLFGFVLDWEDGSTNPQWSETEEKYILRLFFEYMFHPYSNEVRKRWDVSAG